MVTHIPNVLNPRDGVKYLSDDQRAEKAAGLRELADWIENTELPIPRSAAWALSYGIDIEASKYPEEDRELLSRPGHVSKLIGGKVDKGLKYAWDPASDFTLSKTFAGGVPVKFTFDRATVCTAREVEKEVTKFVVDPDKKKLIDEQIAALNKEREELPSVPLTTTETVVEYDCPESLLAMDREARGELPRVPGTVFEDRSASKDSDESVPF